MAAIDPRVIYDFLLGQGVSPASAAGILANIQAESGFNPSAVGDGGTSGGLFQHHASRWESLKAFAAQRGTSWSNWQSQVLFALQEARQMGLSLTHTDAREASIEWTLRFERPANAQAKAQQRAANVGTYNYGGAAASGGSSGGNVSGNAAPQPGAEALNLPGGGSWFNVNGQWYVAYRFYGVEGGPTRVNYYRSATGPPDGVRVHSATVFNQYKANWTDGGTTDAFRGVPAGKTYQQLVNDTLMQLGLAGTDALKDPGVMAIVSLAMTRELSPEELANRLRQTKWYQSRTDQQREWDDLSQAEKDKRVVDEAMKLSGLWFTYVGADLEMSGADLNDDGLVTSTELRKYNPELFKWATNIANGTATQSQAINSWMKEEAAENPNSPWGRTLREEEQAQGQHGVDVANMAGQIRDLYYAWGMPLTDDRAKKLAEKVVMNDLAIEDLEDTLRDQASALYPNKPASMTTREYAEPYMQSYMSLLETPEVGLRDAMLQRGMKEGMTLADFDKMLRHDDRWLETDNARATMNEQFSGLGRVMGF
jgi:hypothetical protein